MCFETERVMDLQGHPRSLILASSDFLLVINSNLGPILHYYNELAIYCMVVLSQSNRKCKAVITIAIQLRQDEKLT